jgi:hypothetical protein
MSEPRRTLIYFAIYFGYHFSGMLLESAFSISTAYYLNNYWHPMLMLIITQAISCTICHVVIKKWISGCVLKCMLPRWHRLRQETEKKEKEARNNKETSPLNENVRLSQVSQESPP